MRHKIKGCNLETWKTQDAEAAAAKTLQHNMLLITD